MYHYALCEELFKSEELGEYKSFGLELFKETSDGREKIGKVSDISTDKNSLTRLSEMLNKNDIEPSIFEEILEDFLAEI